jgi:hypothetical protein
VDYYQRTHSDRELRGHDSYSGKQERAGIKQEEAIKDWLLHYYFAAARGDAPSFERWPSPQSYYLHECILALWGIPIEEMLDLENVSQPVKKSGRCIFFFSSLVCILICLEV